MTTFIRDFRTPTSQATLIGWALRTFGGLVGRTYSIERPCHYCGAAPGAPCTDEYNPGGFLPRPHVGRSCRNFVGGWTVLEHGWYHDAYVEAQGVLL